MLREITELAPRKQEAGGDPTLAPAPRRSGGRPPALRDHSRTGWFLCLGACQIQESSGQLTVGAPLLSVANQHVSCWTEQDTPPQAESSQTPKQGKEGPVKMIR